MPYGLRSRGRVSAIIEYLEDRRMLSVAGGFQLAPVLSGVTVSTQVVPNDPSYGSLWGMGKISAPQAWDQTTGSTNITVANIDSGIDYTHNDLYENVWVNQAEIPADRKLNLVDLDGDGRITLYDLNNPVNQGPAKIIDTNADSRIDARDLLAPAASGGWADGSNGMSYGSYTYNNIVYPADPYIDDIIGWNFATNTNNPFDGGSANGGHGTHTAGTIGAMGSNSLGVAGVNWKTQIMSLKIFSDAGSGVVDTLIGNAIRYAGNNGAVAANASWGGSGGVNNMSDPLYASIKESGDRTGMLFVAAAGNGNAFGQGYSNDAAATSTTYPVFPATYNLPNIIAVAATTSTDGLASYSNYGPTSVDLGAPGSGVLSTLPGNTYASYSGTSMATPHVTGVAALLKSIAPNATYSTLKTAILGGVDAVSSLAGKTVTGGRLNAYKALQNLPLANPAAPTNMQAVAASSSQINITWTNATGESGYRLQRSTDSTFANAALIFTFTLPADTTGYNDSGLAASTMYYYRLQSIGASTDSSFVTANATTLAATAVAPLATRINSTVSTPSTITLNWSNVANESGYKVEQSIGGVWTQIGAPTNVDVVSFTVTGLQSNRSYTFRVLAYNAAGNPPYSNTVSVKTTRQGTATKTFAARPFSTVTIPATIWRSAAPASTPAAAHDTPSLFSGDDDSGSAEEKVLV